MIKNSNINRSHFFFKQLNQAEKESRFMKSGDAMQKVTNIQARYSWDFHLSKLEFLHESPQVPSLPKEADKMIQKTYLDHLECLKNDTYHHI